jgi:hypothetical protein
MLRTCRAHDEPADVRVEQPASSAAVYFASSRQYLAARRIAQVYGQGVRQILIRYARSAAEAVEIAARDAASWSALLVDQQIYRTRLRMPAFGWGLGNFKREREQANVRVAFRQGVCLL